MNTTNIPNYVPSSALFAQLLSREKLFININNQNKTATFQPDTRTLTLPNWNGFESDAWYLLIAHEVGHALFTPPLRPFEPKFEQIAKQYNITVDQVNTVCNVVDDVRIERKIREKYRGLTGVFSRGYTELIKNDFFGFGSVDNLVNSKWNTFKTLDKLNIYAKIGGLVNGITLTNPNQINWYNQSLKAETYEEVIAIAEDIIKTIQMAKEESKKSKPKKDGEKKEGNKGKGKGKGKSKGAGGKGKGKGNGQDSGPTDRGARDIESDDEDENDEENDSSGGSDESDENSDESEEKSGSGSGDESGDDDEDEDSEGTGSGGDGNGDDDSEDEINESAGSGAGGGTNSLLEEDFNSSTRDHSEKKLNRAANNNPYGPTRVVIDDDHLGVLNYNDQSNESVLKNWGASEANKQRMIAIMNSYHNNSKMVLSSMVAKFRALQSAITSRRTQISKTGLLDPNQLQNYKLVEDIFLRRAFTDKGQNHGFVLNLDWSGSMSEVMPTVLWQTLNLIWFAEQLRVPIDVYAFSSTMTSYDNSLVSKAREQNGWGAFHGIGREIQLYTSSSPKKKEAQAFILALIYRFSGVANNYSFASGKYALVDQNLPTLPKDLSDYNYHFSNYSASDLQNTFTIKIDSLDSTPLHNALIASVKIVRDFRIKHKIEKCVSIWLTDGDNGSAVCVKNPATTKDCTGYIQAGSKYFSPMTGKEYVSTTSNSVATEYHRDATGATVIFLHLTDVLDQLEDIYISSSDWAKIISATSYTKFVDDAYFMVTRKTLGYGADAVIATTNTLWTGYTNTAKNNIDGISDNIKVRAAYANNTKNASMRKLAELVVPFLAQGRKS